MAVSLSPPPQTLNQIRYQSSEYIEFQGEEAFRKYHVKISSPILSALLVYQGLESILYFNIIYKVCRYTCILII